MNILGIYFVIAIYSIMKRDKLFFDFMNEIYKDKIILRNYKIQESDLKVFINRKNSKSLKLLLGKELQ